MLLQEAKKGRWVVCAAMVVISGAAAAHAGEVHPTTLHIAVSDGFDSGVFQPAGTDEGDGRYNYRENHYTGGSESWSLTWDFSAVPANQEAAWLTGNFVIRNDGDEDLSFDIVIDMPLPEAAAGAGYYGSASLTILRGTMSALPEDRIYNALIDGAGRDGCYEYPYALEGVGTASDGAAVSGDHDGADASIGIRLAFALSPGARATVLSGWGVDGVGAANGCPGDVDDDGAVGFTDLLRIIGNWGPYEGPIVPEDIDGNHFVGIEDVFEVILGWGDCPGT